MGKQLAVIVTAAGKSARFNEETNGTQKKEYVLLNGHTVLYHSCKHFLNRDDVVCLIVTYPKGEREKIRAALEDILEQRKVQIYLVEGGNSRQESVCNALSELKNMQRNTSDMFVAIHDAARPFVSSDLIAKVVDEAEKVGSATPVLPVTDTMVRLDVEHNLRSREDRANLYSVQTPQVFAFPDILEAHIQARLRAKTYSDDATLYMEYGRKVASVPGDADNIKITYAKDLK